MTFLKRKMKKRVVQALGCLLAMTMVAGGVATADASTIHRDDWYLNKITPTTGTMTHTVSLKKNGAESSG